MPRNTEYGGVVERAVFVIANSGLGRLDGSQNLAMGEDALADAPFPRGVMNLRLSNGDLLTAGIDACDTLVVQYRSALDNAMVYKRQGLDGGKLGPLWAMQLVPSPPLSCAHGKWPPRYR